MPYWRPEKDRPCFDFRKHDVTVTDEVWKFFRDIRHIEQLGEKLDIGIKVVAEQFDHANRASYLGSVIAHIRNSRRPLLVFLDPDTGLEPKHCDVKHTTAKEIQGTWGELRQGDWLVLYQHARHKPQWTRTVSRQLRILCGGAGVEIARSDRVGKDVAFMCIERRVD